MSDAWLYVNRCLPYAPGFRRPTNDLERSFRFVAELCVGSS
jgi:hypothetical protein